MGGGPPKPKPPPPPPPAKSEAPTVSKAPSAKTSTEGTTAKDPVLSDRMRPGPRPGGATLESNLPSILGE